MALKSSTATAPTSEGRDYLCVKFVALWWPTKVSGGTSIGTRKNVISPLVRGPQTAAPR